MLNRRALRIKVMQVLFAFDQCKEANRQLSCDDVAFHFQPDLNSMEVQDKAALKEKKTQAISHFSRCFTDRAHTQTLPREYAVVIGQALNDFDENVKKDNRFFLKNLLQEMDLLENLYYNTLFLFALYGEISVKQKLPEDRRLSSCAFIRSINQNAALAQYKGRRHWTAQSDLVRRSFKEILKSEPYLAYSAIDPQPSEEDEKKLFKQILRHHILAEGDIAQSYQSIDIRWSENASIIKSLVEKTIKSLNNGEIELQKISLNWEEDRQFCQTLFEATLILDPAHRARIASKTRNWDIERVPLTDRIIIEMALAEILSFSQIPIKVSLNEYIELAKEYGTPNSKQFINGILDVIIKELSEEGFIKKSGRGLIDNK